MTKVKCQLEKPPFHQCCCVCTSHFNIVDDNLDPTKKWICTLPFDMGKKSWGDHPLVVITSEEHSCGCECWNDSRRENTYSKRHKKQADEIRKKIKGSKLYGIPVNEEDNDEALVAAYLLGLSEGE